MSPGCGWCVGSRVQGSGGVLEPPPLLHASDSRSSRLTSASRTHLRTDTQILVFQLARTSAVPRVRACCRHHTKDSRALEADLPQCLHCPQRREGCREGDGDVALGGGPARAQKWQLVRGRLLRACRGRARLEPAHSRLCSPLSGEVKLQLLTSGRPSLLPIVKQCSNFFASALTASPGVAPGQANGPSTRNV